MGRENDMSAYDNYYEYIKGLQISQMKNLRVGLDRKIQSTPIMTRLRHRYSADKIDQNCKDPIDILYLMCDLVLTNSKKWIWIDLAVIYADPNIKTMVNSLYKEKTFLGDNGITFTELKKQPPWFWQSIEKGRVGKYLQLDETMTLQLWERPYNLYAVTEYDKDFRKEWRVGFLEYEGNNYGDTSDFYIIGSVRRIEKAS